MITRELAEAIEALIVRALPRSGANEDPRCLSIYSTEAMFEYYLAPSGLCYEVDLDRSPRFERVESVTTAREVYAHAAAKFPELAELAGCDPGAPPATFDDALAYPAQVIVASDDTDATGTTMIAIAVGNSGTRRLAQRTVKPDERDAFFERIAREHELGAANGDLAWHVAIVAGFHLHDGTTLRTSYVRPWEVDRVRSSRAIDLVGSEGSKQVLADADPTVASRIARDFANWLERPHDDNGTADANADELRLVRACRELAQRNVAIRGHAVQREHRVPAGPFGAATDVAVLLDDSDGAVCIEVTLASGTRRVRLRGPMDHTRTNQYLERCWIIRDIVRAIAAL